MDYEVVRPLEAADLDALLNEEGRKVTSTIPHRKRLMSRHHALARAIAGGAKIKEASIMVGMNPQSISMIMDDPTFRELVNHYQADVQAQYIGMHERLAGLAEDAVEELRGRLEDDPGSIGISALIEMVKVGADRTGHGPQSNQTVNVNIGIADRLAEARRRVAEARGKVIEHDG